MTRASTGPGRRDGRGPPERSDGGRGRRHAGPRPPAQPTDRPDRDPRRRQLQRLREAGDRPRPAPVRRARRSGTEPAAARSRHRPDRRLLARPRAGTPCRASFMRSRRTVPGLPDARTRFDSDAGPARPVRPRVATPPGYRRRGGGRPGRCGDPDEECGRRHARLRLGRRPAARPPLARDGHLRSARPRLHGSPELRARARASRHVRRFHREDPVPGRPRDHRRRADAGLRVRSRSRRPPGWSTTGATNRSRSSPRIRRTPADRDARPPSTSSATWSRHSTAPGSRSSSMSSTTTPPKQARTDRRSASAASPTTTTTSSTRDRRAPSITAGRGNTFNANHPIVRRLILDSLRYWVEEMHVDGFRFDLAAVLSRDEQGRPMSRPADALGHRERPGTRRHQAHRGSLGCRRSVPGRQLRRRPVGGVERPVPRRRPLVRQGRSRDVSPPSCNGSSAAPTSTGTSGRETAGERQLRHLS